MATIINNSGTTLEYDVLAPNPYMHIVDPETGLPLSGGSLYFGVVGLDPEIEAYQKKVYLLQENGNAVAIPQPVEIGAGGVPQYNEMPAALALNGAFSYKVLDRFGAQKYYLPKVTTPDLVGFSGVIQEEAKSYVGSTLIEFDVIEASTASFYASSTGAATPFNGALMRKDVDYAVTSSTEITLITSYPLNTVILGRALDPSGSAESVSGVVSNMLTSPTVADAKTYDFLLGDTVTINGSLTEGDGLGGEKYICVSPATGTPDDENFIDLDNGRQLQLISSNRVIKKYAQKTASAGIASGVIVLDLENGTDFTVTLSENITNLSLSNINTLAGTSTTFTLKVKQSAGTLYDITWPAFIKWAGGSAPTITQTINREDVFGFITYDGGTTVYGAIMGQDYAV